MFHLVISFLQICLSLSRFVFFCLPVAGRGGGEKEAGATGLPLVAGFTGEKGEKRVETKERMGADGFG